MKTVNKYLFLLAAAVFGLTACEKQQEREPSPVDQPGAVAFTSAGAAVEINKQKEPLEKKVTLIRTQGIEQEASITLVVDSADAVFVIDPVVKFAAGEKEASTVVKFPSAESDNTYFFKLSIPEDKRSLYLDGNTSFEFSATIVNWTDPQIGVLTDFSLPNLYGFDVFSWYVSYIYDLKNDGSFKLRILNPFYEIAVGDEAADENGVFPRFLYNEEGDLMRQGDYNINIRVDADGVATVEDFSTGMAWTDGEISIHNFKTVATGTGAFGNKVQFDIASKQMVVALGGEAYNYAGFTFYFNVDAFNADKVEIVPVNAEVESYVGNWKLKAKNFKTQEDVDIVISVATDIDEDGQYYIINGIHEDAPEIYGYFDEDLHTFILAPSYGVKFEQDSKTYQTYWYPMTEDGSLTRSLVLELKEDGTLGVHQTSNAVAFALLYENVADEDDYFFGDAFLISAADPTTEEPNVSQEGAPRRAKAAKNGWKNKRAILNQIPIH